MCCSIDLWLQALQSLEVEPFNNIFDHSISSGNVAVVINGNTLVHDSQLSMHIGWCERLPRVSWTRRVRWTLQAWRLLLSRWSTKPHHSHKRWAKEVRNHKKRCVFWNSLLPPQHTHTHTQYYTHRSWAPFNMQRQLHLHSFSSLHQVNKAVATGRKDLLPQGHVYFLTCSTSEHFGQRTEDPEIPHLTYVGSCIRISLLSQIVHCLSPLTDNQ